MCIKSDFKEIVLKFVTNDRSDKMSLLTSKYVLNGGCLLLPRGYIDISNHEKNVYKIRLQRDFFKTCSKWPKWQAVSVTIKILSPRGCLPLTHGYKHLLNHEKMCIENQRLKRCFLNLQHMTKVMRPSCRRQNFGPNGLSAPARAIYMYKIMQKCA